jgi:tetratricopeptide (TPR) repeat protein
MGVVKLIHGDKAGAVEEAQAILKYDKFEAAFESKGRPNTYARLSKEFARGSLIASQQTLVGLDPRERTVLTVADYQFEREAFVEAETLYRKAYEIRAVLPVHVAAYVTFMYAESHHWQFDLDATLRILTDFDRHPEYANTPYWAQAKFIQGQMLACYGDAGLEKSLDTYDQVIALSPDPATRRAACVTKCQVCMTYGRYDQAKQLALGYLKQWGQTDPVQATLAAKVLRIAEARLSHADQTPATRPTGR